MPSTSRVCSLALVLAIIGIDAAAQDIFPYPIHERQLANGLRVITIPYDSPGLVSFYLTVRTGSRDEVEEGHSGFAHFFEHMMFRGTPRFPQEKYNEILKRMGADANAFTDDDKTVYHITGPASGFETMVEIEADRFKHLKYAEEAFRTEARAVLGEYNKSASNPFLALREKLRELAFTKHTYGHTTLGRLEDIKAMPGYYEYSLSFFDRFYRPENTVAIVVGDITPEQVFATMSRHFGDWKSGYRASPITAEPPQTAPQSAHITWPTTTRPYLMLGYRTPAFSSRTVDFATLDVIAQMLFSEASPLYQELVIRRQWVDFLSGGAEDHRDPYLFTIATRAKEPALMPQVQKTIEAHLAQLAKGAVDAGELDRIKSHLRYSFALSLDSPDAIAERVAHYVGLTGSVATINELFRQYAAVTPADVQRVARETFQPDQQTLVTLSSDATSPLTAQKATGAPTSAIELVTMPVPDSPLVAVRLMFRAGSSDDPLGKEGLAALTALMVGSSGTAKRTYADLSEALYPMAAGIGVATDREVSVVSAEVHRDTLPRFIELFEEVILAPGFREDDFRRHRDQLRAFLTTTLRSASDELLGLEMIQQVIFEGHPYGHAPAGTVPSLDRITLDDVKTFYREHYTQANLILGVGGGYDKEFPAEFAATLARLPAGTHEDDKLPPPPAQTGRHFTIIDKATDSVGIHFGYPLPITRDNPDFYPLMVANSFLGEHRTFHGRLMQELRGKRGLNYGDYSYIEYWDNAPGTTNPAPNAPRRQQYFSVWVRPVAPQQALFALRAALHEVQQLVARGLTQQEFDLTRDFLLSYSKLWARSLADRLGFHMDSRFYGMPYFIDEIEKQLNRLTLADVNRAIKQYLQTDTFSAVLIASDAARLREQLESGQPSPIEYANPVGEDVTSADRQIIGLPLNAKHVDVIPIGETFTRTPPATPQKQ